MLQVVALIDFFCQRVVDGSEIFSALQHLNLDVFTHI
jgi:hypothetical protein